MPNDDGIMLLKGEGLIHLLSAACNDKTSARNDAHCFNPACQHWLRFSIGHQIADRAHL